MAPDQPAAYTGLQHFRTTTPSPFVEHVEIDRPAKLNAFHEPMWLELGRLFRQLSVDPDVRCIVLSGAGDRAFTAGLDVQAAGNPEGILGGAGDDTARKAARLRRHIVEFQECVSAVEKCEKRKGQPWEALGSLGMEQIANEEQLSSASCTASATAWPSTSPAALM